MSHDSVVKADLLRLVNKTRHIVDSLEYCGGESMIVGGAVRDTVLNQKVPSKDIDIATTMDPPNAMQCLESSGFKVIDTGSKFGSFTAIDRNGSIFEITSLRKDVKCDGRHAKVIFGGTFAQDSLRRDFTINALYLDKSGRIHDFHNGINDLRNGVVRFIGEPKERVQEDFLRILRFFRFSARFAKELDQEAMSAISDLSSGLQYISKERIHNEFLRTILFGRRDVINAMHHSGVINAIFGSTFEINYNDLEFMGDVLYRGNILNCNPNALALFYFALSSSCKADTIKRIALSREENKLLDILNILEPVRNAVEITALIRQIIISNHRNSAKYALSCNRALSMDVILDLINRSEKMPFDGNDIMNTFHLTSSKNVGNMLDTAKQIWIESNFSASKEDIMHCLHQKHLVLYQN